jgi:hypothetical protein
VGVNKKLHGRQMFWRPFYFSDLFFRSAFRANNLFFLFFFEIPGHGLL